LNPIETSWETISSFGTGIFDSTSPPGTVLLIENMEKKY